MHREEGEGKINRRRKRKTNKAGGKKRKGHDGIGELERKEGTEEKTSSQENTLKGGFVR